MANRLLPFTRFASAFRAQRLDAREVARRCLDAIQDVDALPQPMRPFISYSGPDVEKHANQSAQRYGEGAQLGPLDGIPIAIKDNVDVNGYRTTAGTDLLGRKAATRDSAIVATLRKQGAVILGKANMHEIGMGATGINPHHGTARNPVDPTRVPGGSSSGSATAVAMGLCPIAIGTDTAGSVRIPAALNGVVGLKPTFGRISRRGVVPLAWSFDCVGALGATVADVTQLYTLLAGPDAEDPATVGIPTPAPVDFTRGIQGVRVGVDEAWLVGVDPAVAKSVREARAALTERGATTVDVTIPHLKLLRAVSWAIACAEGASVHAHRLRDHGDVFGPDVRLGLQVGRRLPAMRYLEAQRARSLLQAGMQQIFQAADVLLTPTTAIPAPILHDDALGSGEIDDAVNEPLTRFVTLASVTGAPAVSVPGLPTDGGLPTGLQLMARPFDEDTLLRTALVLEEWSQAHQPQARIFYDVLQ